MAETAARLGEQSATHDDRTAQDMVVKRCWGLGNVICLLPVLDKLCERGHKVGVITRDEWVAAMSRLRPNILWQSDLRDGIVDLDAGTEQLRPQEHRTDEFGRLLGVAGPFSRLKIDPPGQWTHPWEHLRGSVVFAPEGGHPSRCWPTSQASRLWQYVRGNLVLVGTSDELPIPCNLDTRGKLSVEQLIGLLAVAAAVVTMDSAVLHIAAAVGVPTVAIFGGVDPHYRVRENQSVVMMQADMPCCPCNKDEHCAGTFPCIAAAAAEQVGTAVELAKTATKRTVMRV